MEIKLALKLQNLIRLYFGPRIKGLWKNSRRVSGKTIKPPGILNKHLPAGYALDFSRSSPKEVRNFMRRAVRLEEIDQAKLVLKNGLNISSPSTGLWNKNQLTALEAIYGDSNFFGNYMAENEWHAPVTVINCARSAGLSGKKLKILDVGCHEGFFLDVLKMAEEGGTFSYTLDAYTGIDFSVSAVRTAKQKHPNHIFIGGDALSLESYNSIPDNSQNLIVCSGVCDYLTPKQIKLLLSILGKKLKTDGIIIITYRTSFIRYGIDNPQPITYFSTNRHHEDGISFLSLFDQTVGLTDNIYHPDGFEKIIKSSGFKIDTSASKSWPADDKGHENVYDFVVLRNKRDA